MVFEILLYSLAVYGGWTFVKKVRRVFKQGSMKRQLLESKTLKRLAGRK